ncbi:hypothetical protein N2P70_22030, partial [Escherichia coli]|nr:hypothetical protein [Escherichia coli]
MEELQLPSLRVNIKQNNFCLLYTSDAADEARSVDLGCRRIIKKKKKKKQKKKKKKKNKKHINNQYLNA